MQRVSRKSNNYFLVGGRRANEDGGEIGTLEQSIRARTNTHIHLYAMFSLLTLHDRSIIFLDAIFIVKVSIYRC